MEESNTKGHKFEIKKKHQLIRKNSCLKKVSTFFEIESQFVGLIS